MNVADQPPVSVALYARVSSVAQDVDLSIAAQLKALREHARTNGFVVVDEFVDEAKSGRTADRKEFLRMVSLAKSKPAPFQLILVWKLSRFARNREDAVFHKALLRRRGIRVVSINEPVDDTPSGRLIEGVIESMDEFYSANLAQDVTRGMRETASRGFWVSSNTPYGYRRVRVSDGAKERTKLAIKDDEAAVVRMIFAEASSGVGSKEIAIRLNNDGIRSPGGKRWGKATVHAMLRNPVYRGDLVFGKNGRYHQEAGIAPLVVPGAVPAIIDSQKFDAVQSALESRAPTIKHPRRTAGSYLLSGLLHCGECGAAMYGHGAKSGQYHYYICTTASRSGNEACSASPVERTLIEARILERLLHVILADEHIERLVELTNEYLAESSDASKSVEQGLEKDLKDVRSRLAKLYEAMETSELDLADLAPRIKQLRLEERQMDAARARAQERSVRNTSARVELDQVLEQLRDLKGLLDSGSTVQRKQFVSALIKRITKTGDQISIDYTLPVDEGSETRSYSVPRIDLSGGPGRVRTCDRSVMSRLL